MNQKETSSLLAVIKAAFPEFEITPEVIRVWHGFLQEVTYPRAQANLHEYIKTSRFAPRIADVIREDDSTGPQSVYEVQRLEAQQAALELQEYHERENAKPMPEHVARKLNDLFSKAKVNTDEL